MNIVSLLEFARSGQFGPITIGSTRTHVRTAFGDPTNYTAGQPRELADVWKYGDLEVYFTDELVWLLHFDWFDVPEGGSTLKIDPWIIRHRLLFQEWEQAASAAGIEFVAGEDPVNPGCIKAITSAGVVFIFDVEESPAGLAIFGISNWKPTL